MWTHRTGSSTLPEAPLSPAERWFRRGMELARIGRYHEALEPLEQALALSVEEPNARYLRALRSWYGLVIALARGDFARGRRLCEEAIADGPLDPDLYVNLARVYLRGNRKQLAVEALDTALAIDPHHRQANRLRDQLGRRREPVFGFLDRSHPLNRYAGMVRNRLENALGRGARRSRAS